MPVREARRETLTNSDTTIVGIDNGGAELLCLFDASVGHCKTLPNTGLFVTTNMCVTSGFYNCPGGSATSEASFGSIYFHPTDRNTMFVFSNTTNSITTPTSVCVFKINVTTNDPGTGITGIPGSYSITDCVVRVCQRLASELRIGTGHGRDAL